MPRFKIIWPCLLVFAMFAAAGCRKDNPQSAKGFKMDDARFLMTNLVFTDEFGIITGYMSGYGLNAADPGEVSIPCTSLEQAQELFRSWLPEDADIKQDGETLSWNMSDTLGVSQGAAVLKAGGDKGAVAHLELPARFPAVTGVQFLPRSAFPQNAELDYVDALDEFYFLNVLNVYPDMEAGHGRGAMVVVREYDQDTNTCGILLSTPEQELDFWTFLSNEEIFKKRSRSLAELQLVGKEYRKFWKEIDKALTDGLRNVNGDHYFLCYVHKLGNESLAREYECYNFRNDDTGRIDPLFGKKFYEAYAYFFTVEKKNNVYQVVLK